MKFIMYEIYQFYFVDLNKQHKPKKKPLPRNDEGVLLKTY